MKLSCEIEPGKLTKASLHQLYGGRPRRGTPGEAFTVLFAISSSVRRFTRAWARETASAEVLQTRLSFNGPFAQSGNAANAVCEAAAVIATNFLKESWGIVETK
jgi:hypothetical protein